MLTVALALLFQSSGNVELPLDVYHTLWTNQQQQLQPAPAPFAFGHGTANADVRFTPQGAQTQITFSFTATILDEGWVKVPLLVYGPAIDQVLVQGKPATLHQAPEGWCWSTDQKGSYTIQLTYRVVSSVTPEQGTLSIPIPAVPSTALQLKVQGSDRQITVVPAVIQTERTIGGTTEITASLPATSVFHVGFTSPTSSQITVSQAHYTATQAIDHVQFKGTFQVHVQREGAQELALLPDTVTLHDVRLNGKPGVIRARDHRFWLAVRDAGSYELSLTYEVPIRVQEGLPFVDVPMMQVPISRMELSFMGRKEVTVQPGTGLQTAHTDDKTSVSLFVPMSHQVRFSWTEAVPDDLTQEFRANAQMVSLVHADEGVMLIQTRMDLDVSRGSASVLELVVPEKTQIVDVRGSADEVSEWTTQRSEGAPQLLRVFLNRQVDSHLQLTVWCEQPLDPDQSQNVPILSVANINRQGGLVALLSSRSTMLNPETETNLTRVGENQIPVELRQDLEMVIAHTFKFGQDLPQLTVQLAEPERMAGRFDVMVDTLISLNDVSMKAAASFDCLVKSGLLGQLEIILPSDVNLLHVSAPSMRNHVVVPSDVGQRVQIFFTQELEGQIRVEMDYERIIDFNQAQVNIPLAVCEGAEVQQGRVALEALTAVEVQPANLENVTEMDWQELPQSLMLKTSNPILAAFKYVRVAPPVQLDVAIKRHAQLEVQSAVIDRADVTTLITREGLVVHRYVFRMRNNSQQFLRLPIHRDVELWSAFVAGKPVKPAVVDEDNERAALINIIHASEPFEIELVLATPGRHLGSFGSLRTKLPLPETTTTQLDWRLFLPDGLTYQSMKSNLDPGQAHTEVGMDEAMRKVASPLSIQLPQSGVQFELSKLYPNRSEEPPYVSLSYVSATTRKTGLGLHVLALAVLMAGGYAWMRHRDKPHLRWTVAVGGLMALVVWLMTGVSGAPILIAGVILAGLAVVGQLLWQRRLNLSVVDKE
ncbi:MAG: MnhB domain-containing protein [Acidobacteria bacterium]|nr:MnhB domain-containing protein [Acidobacteriota bacterium]